MQSSSFFFLPRRDVSTALAFVLVLSVLVLLPSAPARAADGVELSVATSSATESAGEGIPTLLVTGTYVGNETIDVVVTGGTATSADYTNTVTVGIPPGTHDALPVDITLAITPDTLDEDDETIELTLQSASGISIDDANADETIQSTHTYTIQDDDDPPTVSISGVTVAEGDTGTTNADFSISLSAVSGKTVIVTATTADGTATTADSDYTATTNQFTFTPGQTTKTFTVPVNGDEVDEDNETFIATLSAPTHATITGGPATGTITDDDTAGVTITEIDPDGTPPATDPAEGGKRDTYTVVLDTKPRANVVITGSDLGDQVLVTRVGGGLPPVLTFTPTNWFVEQTLRVVAIDDDVDEPTPHSDTVVNTATSADPKYNGIDIATVSVFITDNDTAGATLTPDTIAATEGGATGSYTVVLESEPTAEVTVSLAVGPDATVSKNVLTFTKGGGAAPWDVPQSITVSAVDDNIAEGPHTDTITHTASSADPLYDAFPIGDATVNVTDDDAPGVSIIQTGGTTSVIEGSVPDTYQIVLTTRPTANVTVTATTSDSDVSVGAAAGGDSVTFTPSNWSTPQGFTVTATDDDVDELSPQAALVEHAVSSVDPMYDALGGPSLGLAVSVVDDDVAGFSASPNTVNVAEPGSSDSYTVVLDSKPTSDVTVTPSAAGGEVTVTPSAVTFTSTDWDTPRAFTVTPIDDGVAEGDHSDAISHLASSTDPFYSGIAGEAVAVNITDDDGLAVTVTGPEFGAPGETVTFSTSTNSSSGSMSYTWQVARLATVVATGFEETFSFTPTLGGAHFVNVVIEDDGAALPAVAVLFNVLGDIGESVFADDIIWLATNGITKGCNPPLNDLFCPNDSVTRGQFAAFLDRALGLPATSTDFFGDDDTSIFEGNINRLAASGVTRGCNPPANTQFCPDDTLSRGQMAAFLDRALGLPAASKDYFVDDDDSIFEGSINRLAQSGITRGCNPPANDLFCAAATVTRGQMAAFLRRSAAFWA